MKKTFNAQFRRTLKKDLLVSPETLLLLALVAFVLYRWYKEKAVTPAPMPMLPAPQMEGMTGREFVPNLLQYQDQVAAEAMEG